MSCIGTAGHVDHGKSTLVTALTGMDPDRLAEEKARGMTIDLGFAWLTLPSGREASIVDVPGHESFIKNMLAGVGGIDVALLVIAADEGIMPQTAEHLAILDLLRVRTGVVALTKCDLVDEEWLDLVREEISERIATTSLANAPIIACSSVTRVGLPELLDALDNALAVSETRRDRARPRLPVDRVFTITGFGTVVTGTLQDGTLQVGQEVTLLPRGLRTRIRGLQAHKHAVEQGLPGGRIAVNLAGIARSDVTRGDVLALPGTMRPTIALDARIEVLADASRPIQHNAELEVYVGAAEVPARLVLLDGDEVTPGAHAWAQLRLRRPLVVARGDRFILRSPSPSTTVGGGTVVEPWARRHRHGDAAVLARLDVLARGDPEEVVLSALRVDTGRAGTPIRRSSGYGGKELAELVRLCELPESVVTDALVELESRMLVERASATYFAASEWEHLQADASRLLATYHAQFPLRAGMPREEWRSRLGLSMREASDVLAAFTRTGAITEVGLSSATSSHSATAQAGRGTVVRLVTHQPRLSAAQEQEVAAMLTRFRQAPFEPPTRQDVDAALGSEVVAALIERGTLVRISDSVLLEPDPWAEAQRRILTHLRSHGSITVAQARDLLGTTRKYTLAIFEHLDERRITRRNGDDRALGPRAPLSDPNTSPGT